MWTLIWGNRVIVTKSSRFILCGSGSYYNLFTRNDVLACCVLGRGRRDLAFRTADRIGRYNGSHTRLSFWWLKRCQSSARNSQGASPTGRKGVHGTALLSKPCQLVLFYEGESRCNCVVLRQSLAPELTGLEPATSAVTGRRSNQLSYNSSEKVVKLELNRGGFNRKFSKKRKGSREATIQGVATPRPCKRGSAPRRRLGFPDERELIPTGATSLTRRPPALSANHGLRPRSWDRS
jgi:hypothetical protein